MRSIGSWFQAKEVFINAGTPVPEGKTITSGDEAVEAAGRLTGPPWVVKAQVHAGGSGKGGGVQVVHTLDEVKTATPDPKHPMTMTTSWNLPPF
ncbi:MAG: hypothetical protein JRJ82_03545 [Deltaproteobacteria bacterium]|nr:hypothetical protein [Deltaproteobacteria bacterium]